jgi:hypothetical protein
LRLDEAAYRITASFEVGFRLAVEGMEWIQAQRRRTDEKNRDRKIDREIEKCKNRKMANV